MLEKIVVELRQIAAAHQDAGDRAFTLQSNWDTLLRSNEGLNELSKHDPEGHIHRAIGDTSAICRPVLTTLMESMNAAKDSIDFLNTQLTSLNQFLDSNFEERNKSSTPHPMTANHRVGSSSSSSSHQQHPPAAMPTTWARESNNNGSSSSRATPQPHAERIPSVLGDYTVTSPVAPPPDIQRPTISRLLVSATPSNHDDENSTTTSKSNMISTIKLSLTAKGVANVAATPTVKPNPELNLLHTAISSSFSDIVISNNAEVVNVTPVSLGVQSVLSAVLPGRKLLTLVHDERCVSGLAPINDSINQYNSNYSNYDPRIMMMMQPSYQHQGGGGSMSPVGGNAYRHHSPPMGGWGSTVAPPPMWSSPHPYMSAIPPTRRDPVLESSGMGFTTVGILGLASVLMKEAASCMQHGDSETTHKGLYVVRPDKKEEASNLVERLRKVVDSELTIINLIGDIVPSNIPSTGPRLIVATTEHVEDRMIEALSLTRLVWDGFRQIHTPLIQEFANLVGITLRGPSADLATAPASAWGLLYIADVVCHKQREVVVVYVENDFTIKESVEECILVLPHFSPTSPPLPPAERTHMPLHNTSISSAPYTGMAGGESPSYRQPQQQQYGGGYPPSSLSPASREQLLPPKKPLLNVIITEVLLTATQRDHNRKTGRDGNGAGTFYASALESIEDDIGCYLDGSLGMIDNIVFEWHRKLNTTIIAAKAIARYVTVLVRLVHYDEGAVIDEIGTVIGVTTINTVDLRSTSGRGGGGNVSSSIRSGRSLPRVQY